MQTEAQFGEAGVLRHDRASREGTARQGLPRRRKQPKPCPTRRRNPAAIGDVCDMSNDDWKKSLPFSRHWAVYLLFKLLVLALAVFVAWQLLHAFAVV